MDQEKESLTPVEGAKRPRRRRLSTKHEFALALLPTGIILLVLFVLETISRERLLFASLASSAFLIYLDPKHGTNTTRSLVISHISAAVVGLVTFNLIESVYMSAAVAMVITITLMILLDVVHPPAVSTSLIFAFRVHEENNLILFGLAVGIVALLVVLQRTALWLMDRLNPA